MPEKPRVLIVDDEPNILMSLQFLMRQEGFDVRTASDGEEALSAVAEDAPDLILLDVMMPKRDGYDVCQAIRSASGSWRDVPIIMLTARGRDIDREKGLALGASAYITKPFSIGTLLDRIGSLLSPAPGDGPGSEAFTSP